MREDCTASECARTALPRKSPAQNEAGSEAQEKWIILSCQINVCVRSARGASKPAHVPNGPKNSLQAHRNHLKIHEKKLAFRHCLIFLFRSEESANELQNGLSNST